MPTVNPRISVTLKPEVAAVLRRVCDLAEKSQSAFVGELLEQSMPVFERMARLLEAAHMAKEHLAKDMAGSLDRAQSRIEAQFGLALEHMDEGFRPILEAAEEVQRRKAGAGGPRPAGGAATDSPPPAPTPMSNRGVTPHPRRRGKGPK